MNKLVVSEVFYSIDGEGNRTGLPVVFIRLFGCNLQCSYCDSCYTWKERGPEVKEMTIEEIFAEVDKYGCKRVTLTGGEPLLQDVTPLLVMLYAHKYEVNIETNGAVELLNLNRYKMGKVYYTMDWKCPSSGMLDKMIKSNLYKLRQFDVLKFVVGSVDDLKETLTVYKELYNKQLAGQYYMPQIYISPVWGKIELSTIVDFIKVNKLYNARVQIQLHKVIWDPQERGV